jgi:hypothetical protein
MSVAVPQPLPQSGFEDSAMPFVSRANNAGGAGVAVAGDRVADEFSSRERFHQPQARPAR